MNLSLGGPVSESLDAAILRGIEKGIHFTVAAGRCLCYSNKYPSYVVVGNSDAPAKNSSPARVQGAVTVGAVDSKSDKACFSNYGPELAGGLSPSSLGQYIDGHQCGTSALMFFPL